MACALPLALPASARAGDPVLAAAGDISCPPGSAVTTVSCRQQFTSDLLVAAQPAAVAALGDNQYESGTLAEFTGPGAFAATWGRVRPALHPTPGNHEYTSSPTADGYFGYFGSLAGSTTSGYYSYDVGAWHVVSLNSNCGDGGCSDQLHGQVSTAEVQWLQSDLDAHPGRCTLAYWHHPLFSSGQGGGSPGVRALWDQLHAHHADVALAGHEHEYERFAPTSPAGVADDQGIREFVVGTGGANHFVTPATFDPNSQFFDGIDFGVLLLTLHADSYDWAFEREDGTVVDSGSTPCHSQPPGGDPGTPGTPPDSGPAPAPPPPSAPPGGSTAPTPSGRPPFPSRTTTVRIRRRRGGLVVTPVGVLQLPIACPVVRGGCKATVTLSRPRSRAHRHGVMRVTARVRHLAPGARASLRLQLPGAWLAAVRRGRHPRRLELRLRLDSVFVRGIRTTRTITVVVRLPARRR